MSNPNSPTVKRSNRKKCNAIINDNNYNRYIENIDMRIQTNRVHCANVFLASINALNHALKIRTQHENVAKAFKVDNWMQHEEHLQITVTLKTKRVGQPRKCYNIALPLQYLRIDTRRNIETQ